MAAVGLTFFLFTLLLRVGASMKTTAKFLLCRSGFLYW